MTTPQFTASVVANLAYWETRLQGAAPETLASLEADWPNFNQALKFGFALENATPLALQLTARAFDFVERRGYWQEWVPVLEHAIRLCGSNAPLLRCQLLDQLGSLYRIMVQPEAAQHAFQEAAALAEKLGTQRQLARIWFHLAQVHRIRREMAEAERYLTQAQTLFKEHGSAAQQAAVESEFGRLAQERGALATAEAYYTRSLNLWRATAPPSEIARLYLRLGQVAQQSQNTAAAEAWYQQAQAIYETVSGNLVDKAELALGLGSLYFDLQAWEKAEVVFRQADTAALRRSALVWQRAALANNLGNVLLEQGKLAEAERYLRTAVALYQQWPDDVMLGNTLCTLGVVLTQSQQVAAARAAYDEALPLLARHPQNAFAQRLWAKYKAKRAALEAGPGAGGEPPAP